MKRLYILPLCFMALTLFAANKPVKITYEYTYLSNDRNESQTLAEQHAVERAKQKALEERFGVDVSSIVVTLDQETSHNGQYTTDEDFFSLGGTIARGEWIGEIKEHILDAHHNGEFWFVKVRIEGSAREKSGTPIDISYAFINNAHDRDNRTTYYDGDDIFLRFSSPVDGALCVYLVDAEKQAYCLLPYLSNGQGYQPVTANNEYLFFSRNKDNTADEFTLNTQEPQEHNVLYLVFSPNIFTKAKDSKGDKNWRNETLPRNLAYKDFLKWLAKNQTSDAQLLVRTEVITIKQR